MAKTLDAIDDELATFVAAQKIFFVATAPLDARGHVNLSPKGYDTLRVLDPQTVAYLDLTGSGVETIAHLRENGRVTIMLCAFEGPPRIVRFYGRGESLFEGDPRFAELEGRFPRLAGRRAIVVVKLDRIQSSCGYAVPFMSFDKERTKLVDWAENKGDAGLAKYRRDRNRESIDGLAGFASDDTEGET